MLRAARWLCSLSQCLAVRGVSPAEPAVRGQHSCLIETTSGNFRAFQSYQFHNCLWPGLLMTKALRKLRKFNANKYATQSLSLTPSLSLSLCLYVTELLLLLLLPLDDVDDDDMRHDTTQYDTTRVFGVSSCWRYQQFLRLLLLPLLVFASCSFVHSVLCLLLIWLSTSLFTHTVNRQPQAATKRNRMLIFSTSSRHHRTDASVWRNVCLPTETAAATAANAGSNSSNRVATATVALVKNLALGVAVIKSTRHIKCIFQN